MGQDYQEFLKETNLLNRADIELEEIGTPLSFEWNKCKLETISFGHGISTTPLQVASAYASIVNGGELIDPTIFKKKQFKTKDSLPQVSKSERG